MDQNEALQRLRAGAAKRAEDRARERAAQEDKKQKEAEKAATAKKTYDLWVKRNQPRARKAAHAIWSWYQEFVAGEFFAELKAAYPGKSLDISEEYTLREPTPNYSTGYPYHQYLGINASGVLYAHDCYGKSYKLEEEEELLKQVAWKILIMVATTIENGMIWDVVSQSVE